MDFVNPCSFIAAHLVLHVCKYRLTPFRVFFELRLLLQVQAFALSIKFIIRPKIGVERRCSLRH